MSYAMCLDNSWDVMCEEEMYDVNGGGIKWYWKVAIVAAIAIIAAALVAAITYGQLYLAAKIMGLSFQTFVSKLGAAGVAAVIGESIGVSATTVAGAFYFFTQF